MTRWLVTGAGGKLGRELLAQLGDAATGLSRRDLDVTDGPAVAAAITRLRPEVVVNAAAWTAVDDAESHEAEAAAVNRDGAGHVAAAAASVGARLVHLSTDYVFDGTLDRPYREDDLPGPRSAYGRTKRAGELAVLACHSDAWIVRTAWVYGGHGADFVKTMIRLEAQRPTVEVVTDQVGNPTWVHDLARGVRDLVARNPPPGVYHCVGAGEASWYEVAQAVFRLIGADVARVRPTTSEMLVRPAARPTNSRLSTQRWAAAALPLLPPWHVSLERCLVSRS